MNDNVITGFDRNIDLIPIKKELQDAFKTHHNDLYKKKGYGIQKSNKLIYIVIELIQLKNGSRITEAINAIKQFIDEDKNLDDKVLVKICKSGGTKYKLDNGKKVKYEAKERRRKMVFPKKWLLDVINENELNKLLNHFRIDRIDYINHENMRKRILNYMMKYHKSNTHSLRYAFINYMIYTEKREINDVAKFVGHTNLNQITRYTQYKNCEKIFDIDF
jgi:integrase